MLSIFDGKQQKKTKSKPLLLSACGALGLRRVFWKIIKNMFWRKQIMTLLSLFECPVVHFVMLWQTRAICNCRRLRFESPFFIHSLNARRLRQHATMWIPLVGLRNLILCTIFACFGKLQESWFSLHSVSCLPAVVQTEMWSGLCHYDRGDKEIYRVIASSPRGIWESMQNVLTFAAGREI